MKILLCFVGMMTILVAEEPATYNKLISDVFAAEYNLNLYIGNKVSGIGEISLSDLEREVGGRLECKLVGPLIGGIALPPNPDTKIYERASIYIVHNGTPVGWVHVYIRMAGGHLIVSDENMPKNRGEIFIKRGYWGFVGSETGFVICGPDGVVRSPRKGD